MSFSLKGFHHVAYRCRDAKETVEWYKQMLNADFTLAFAEDRVPSTKEPDPYMHIFIDVGRGNILAFFELPTYPEMGRDPNTPEWCQHICFEVEDRDVLYAAKDYLESQGVEVLGVVDHGIFHSIYFFDPNGHRLELTYNDPGAPGKIARISEQMKKEMLEEWSRTKKAPNHTKFLHEAEFLKAPE